MSGNGIKLRKYYAVQVELRSPCKVSSGQDYYTDSDVQRNNSGEVYVPGTSLAGACRNDMGREKDENCIMGYSKGKMGKMSSLYISDLYFEGAAQTSVRDGVSLSEDKTVQNKFDMEIIETGAKGTFFLEYIVREKENADEFEAAIQAFLQNIENGTIRIGSNKNRGFGRLRICEIFERSFEKGKLNDWLKFLDNYRTIAAYKKDEDKDYSYQAWVQNKAKPEAKYIKVKVPLKLGGGISIRKYSAQPGQADFEHITCNGKPVIPGSSWNGAIRSDARKILQELGHACPERVLKQWFGNCDEGEARQSQVVISESVISGAVRLPMTRNRVNRFDASTISGALYSEIAYFGGKTSLEIMIRKDRDKEYLAILGVLGLIIQDIQQGYVAVGGQTAVGRGIFQEDVEKKVVYSEEITEESCMSALYSLIA